MVVSILRAGVGVGFEVRLRVGLGSASYGTGILVLIINAGVVRSILRAGTGVGVGFSLSQTGAVPFASIAIVLFVSTGICIDSFNGLSSSPGPSIVLPVGRNPGDPPDDPAVTV